jgi:hypothetical protein
MSDQISVAFVDQFTNNVSHLVQQGDSRFQGKVREETQVGKSKFFEQLGSTAAILRTTRHGDTPQVDSVHQRREVTLKDYDWADLIDTLDDNKMLISPQSSYAQSAAMAFNRVKDSEVITAATGNAQANKTGLGANGTAAVALPASQKVAVDFEVAATNTGLTLAKLIEAKSILGKNEVPSGERKYFVHSQQQLDDLLINVNEVNSSDYAAVKALVDGEVSYFMGMEFIKTELTDLDGGTDIRTCFAYSHNGLLRSMGQNFKTRIAERTDKNHAIQVYCNMTVGATRMQEECVVEVLCDESPA